MATLTSKELSGIEDQLKCEETVICKCKMYASDTQDPVLKEKLNELINKHQYHYDTLYSLLS